MMEAVSIALIGIVIVMLSLFFLSLVLSALKFIGGKRKAGGAPSAPEPAESAAFGGESAALAAAVTAAVSAFRSETGEAGGFIVRSLKRADNWNACARREFHGRAF
jgi:Na+-transporting methylmalonyl-CoA/oxaloacetate decarboxylase gamma subunit